MRTIGERIKDIRLKSGMTQEELAAKCGMQKQSISRYENSDRQPNIKIAKELANALGVTLEYLVTGTDVETETDPKEEYYELLNMTVSELSEDQRIMILNLAQSMLKEKRKQEQEAYERELGEILLAQSFEEDLEK